MCISVTRHRHHRCIGRPAEPADRSFGDRRGTLRWRRRVLIAARTSDPARPSSQLKALARKCRGDGSVRDTVVSTKPRQRFTRCVESCCLIDLYVAQALAAYGDALFAEHVGDAGLGDSGNISVVRKRLDRGFGHLGPTEVAAPVTRRIVYAVQTTFYRGGRGSSFFPIASTKSALRGSDSAAH